MFKKLQEVCNQLDPYLEFIYEHEIKFLDKFTINGDDLVEITFSLESFKFVYILDSGQHIVDEKPLFELVEWANEIIKQEKE